MNTATVGMIHPNAVTRSWVGPVMVIFIISMLIPGNFDIIGTISVNASRLVMLVAIIPLTVAWLTGKAGRVILPDILIAAHAIWMLVAFIYNHGMERVPFGIITGIELFGGYLMGRILIRNPKDFRLFFSCLLAVFVILLPFALYELKTGDAIMQKISRSILGISHGDVDHPPRWGFWRVQSVMQHPILFGLFCSFVVANAFYIWRNTFFQWLPRAGLALFLTFSSLSSGPLLAAFSQLGMILWGWITGNKWKMLLALVISLYIFLSVASNRGPVVIMIDTLTFSSQTGWTRIHIFRHGIQNVWDNPIFGLGLREWSRPFWLTSSVDNFWLVVAMRYGLVGFCLLVAALILNLWNVVRSGNLSETADRYRTGYVIGLVGLCFTLATVHIWGPTYVLALFYFGAGTWFFVQTPETIADTEATAHPAASDPRGSQALYARPATLTPRMSREQRAGILPVELREADEATSDLSEGKFHGPRQPYRRGPADSTPSPYRKD